MESTETYSVDEAQPPSCIAPNANDGQDASPVSRLTGSAESVSSFVFDVLASLQRTSLILISSGYSCVREVLIEQGIPVRFARQSSCIKGGDL